MFPVQCLTTQTRPHTFITLHAVCFLPHSGGPGTKRRIAAEALLHVQKPHEDPQQIQQSTEEERLRNTGRSELMTQASHRTSG